MVRCRARKCSYLNCSHVQSREISGEGVRFFAFPSHENLCLEWVNACQNKSLLNIPIARIQNLKYVCSKHFHFLSFINPLRKNKVLKKYAIPVHCSNPDSSFTAEVKSGVFINPLQPVSPGTTFSKLGTRNKVPRSFKQRKELSFEDASSFLTSSPSADAIQQEQTGASCSYSKSKDLVSLERLMDLTENCCPLLRPISPTTTTTISPVTEGTSAPPSTQFNNNCQNLIKNNETSFQYGDRNFVWPVDQTIGIASLAPPLASSLVSQREENEGASGDANRKRKRPLQVIRTYKRILPKITVPSVLENEKILDLSDQSVTCLKESLSDYGLSTLILNNNALSRLPTLFNSFKTVTKICARHNAIASLVWFENLPCLATLDLSHNCIADLEPVWKMQSLQSLHLAYNKFQVLRTPPHRDVSGLNLEVLDLSSNNIYSVKDISMLRNLKELHLSWNKLTSLRHWKRFLPSSLNALSLNNNAISNLGDVTELSSLDHLFHLTFNNNPSVNALQLVDSKNIPVGPLRAFDVRPFVLCWCPHLQTLNQEPVLDRERVKSKWLFSKSRLKAFAFKKNHAFLVALLAQLCPPSDAAGGTTEVGEKVGQEEDLLNGEQTDEWQEKSEDDLCALECPSPDSASERLCPHLVSLMEERAANHQLRRLNGRLSDAVQQLQAALASREESDRISALQLSFDVLSHQSPSQNSSLSATSVLSPLQETEDSVEESNGCAMQEAGKNKIELSNEIDKEV